MHRNRVYRMLGDARSHANQTTQVHNRGEHDALDSELLDAVQQGLAFCTVALARLLLKEFIDIGIPSVSIRSFGIRDYSPA